MTAKKALKKLLKVDKVSKSLTDINANNKVDYNIIYLFYR